MLWDVFISHASEDKADVARPLADSLRDLGLRVWLDEQQLSLGDSLSRKINDGLSLSRFGVLILSKTFLEKDYPQREMQALLARQTADERYILPILHKVDHSVLKRKLPLLGDLLSMGTDSGIDNVAAAIYKAVRGLPLAYESPKGVRYFEAFDFPPELIDDALFAIQRLCSPSSAEEFLPQRDMTSEDTWMATAEPSFVSVLYSLYAPIIHFTKHRYRFERTLTSLRPSERIRFAILDAAVAALTKDLSMAAATPRLHYTPRVSGWRQRRALEPARYWWQGLTLERIKDAVPSFYDSAESTALPSPGSFRRAYEVGFRAFCGGQQTLGLLANPLYGFHPRDRPVYWRILMLWHSLYSTLCQTQADSSSTQLRCFLFDSPWIEATIPLTAFALEELPETRDVTVLALQGYVRDHILATFRELLADQSNA